MRAAFDDDLVLGAVARSRAALVVLDASGRVVRWSTGATRLYGWTEAEVLGRTWLDLELLPDPMRRAQAAEILQAVLAGAPFEGEWVARRADGTTVRVHSVEEPLFDDDGTVVGVVAVSVDVSAREAFEAALLREALHDRLTGLPGRPVLHHHLATLLGERRGGTARAAVLFVDLDDFKDVNDGFGHDVGDRVLVEVARRLRASVRVDDLVCRVGGDEFVVVARLDGGQLSPRDVGERVARALAQPFTTASGEEIPLSASVGVVSATAGDDPDDLVRRADQAMYRAKSQAIAPHGDDHVAVAG